MPDIDLDSLLQPNINASNDLDFIEGREEFEQNLRLVSIDRLFGVLADYNNRDVENKIRVEIRRIARDLDYLDNIHNIKIDKVQAGYETHVEYIEDGDFNFTIDDT